jgi:hypothetical protein
MVHQSEQDGIPSKPEEQSKQPYEKPRVTKRLITREEKDQLIAEQNDKSKGKASGSG